MSYSLIVVGLGNPGGKYACTRHNAGFIVLDRLASALGVSFRFVRAVNAEVASVSLEHLSSFLFSSCLSAVKGVSGILREFGTTKCSVASTVALLKPATYMNSSGDSVCLAKRFFRTDNLIVVHDELAIPFCGLRFKRGGGHAGHNGLKSIDSLCGSDYLRVRFGIGLNPILDLTRFVGSTSQTVSKCEPGNLPSGFEQEAVYSQDESQMTMRDSFGCSTQTSLFSGVAGFAHSWLPSQGKFLMPGNALPESGRKVPSDSHCSSAISSQIFTNSLPVDGISSLRDGEDTPADFFLGAPGSLGGFLGKLPHGVFCSSAQSLVGGGKNVSGLPPMDLLGKFVSSMKLPGSAYDRACLIDMSCKFVEHLESRFKFSTRNEAILGYLSGGDSSSASGVRRLIHDFKVDDVVGYVLDRFSDVETRLLPSLEEFTAMSVALLAVSGDVSLVSNIFSISL